jgi:hypothetical protein
MEKFPLVACPDNSIQVKKPLTTLSRCIARQRLRAKKGHLLHGPVVYLNNTLLLHDFSLQLVFD